MSTPEQIASKVVDAAMRKSSGMMLGAVVWSIGLGIVNTLLLIAVLVVVIVRG